MGAVVTVPLAGGGAGIKAAGKRGAPPPDLLGGASLTLPGSLHIMVERANTLNAHIVPGRDSFKPNDHHPIRQVLLLPSTLERKNEARNHGDSERRAGITELRQ